jgi:aminobenzoyl-glutamate utilization protein B
VPSVRMLSTITVTTIVGLVFATLVVATSQQQTQTPAPDDADPRLGDFKAEVLVDVEARRDFTQKMVDSIFSFNELGFQEFETQRYVTDILEAHGFTVERGIAGIPTSWVATWGSGSPVIALGTDIDGIPQASQKPGVAYRDPLVVGAPGHGEGHNSGQALIVTAALAVKKIMERENIGGTLKLWPGVAEEQLGAKAHLVRAGLFDDVDAVLYCHVGTGLGTSWGQGFGSGLVSVEFLFEGEAAHGAGSPWDGRSALDAVELMNVGWNYRREHLPPQQRSHYVITDGGDQPNVVPPTASVWYFFREVTYERIKNLWDVGEQIAAGAALMTDTEVRSRVLGAAYPMHSNKPLAEAMHANITQVGMPEWSQDDQRMARAVQEMLGVEPSGLSTEVNTNLRGGPALPPNQLRGGPSDDIGDIMWTVPTVTLSFPANIPGGPGHNWNKAIAMATPIAHKGVTAGAKAYATTVLDLLLTPSVLENAWDYFDTVQTVDHKYVSLLRPEDEPAIWLNRDIMDEFRPLLEPYYYDPSKYDTYLEQLGIEYPTVR